MTETLAQAPAFTDFISLYNLGFQAMLANILQEFLDSFYYFMISFMALDNLYKYLLE